MSELKQSRFKVSVEASYWTPFDDTPLDEARRKTIALVEFAKSIGLVVEFEGTTLVSRWPAKEVA